MRPLIFSCNDLIFNKTHIVHGTSIDFKTLQSDNVTSEQLYSWFTPIDVIERYQVFLENTHSSESTQIFYNCSQPWFGEFCQYTWDWPVPINKPLPDFFPSEMLIIDYLSTNGTCYTFLTCDRGFSPSCLDWREICDGKIDCLDDGGDEFGCDVLDMNECEQNEFQCANGLCIHKDFFNDDPYYPDCIDRSDERYIPSDVQIKDNMNCYRYTGFNCDETACRNERTLACGNGVCAVHCGSHRHSQLLSAKLSWDANPSLSFDCWKNLVCLYNSDSLSDWPPHAEKCPKRNVSETLFQKSCPSAFLFPAQSMQFNHVYYGYTNHLPNQYSDSRLLPHYVCYNQQLCEWLPATFMMHNLSCRFTSEFGSDQPFIQKYDFNLIILNTFLKCSTTTNNYMQCPKSKPFRCANSSKCLSLTRLLDGVSDCFQGDDEQILDSCSLPDVEYRFQCSSEHKCIPVSSTGSGLRNCIGGETETLSLASTLLSKYPLSFTILCDGFVEIGRIDGLNYTDESDCKNWPCNNVYTRCDIYGTWNCHDGADEANCSYNPCRPNGHPCISVFNQTFTCLPLSRINDGHIDCIGGYDEQNRCPSTYTGANAQRYRCLDEKKCIHIYKACDSKVLDCQSGDDEGQWCGYTSNSSTTDFNVSPQPVNIFNPSLYLRFLYGNLDKLRVVYFTLKNHLSYPLLKTISPETTSAVTVSLDVAASGESIVITDRKETRKMQYSICNRGFPMYFNDAGEFYCLCSPAYFGSRCQYQSQRVGAVLQFRTAEWRKIFTFVIMLIDENTNIHSLEQVDYVAIRDCRRKFNFYLLYSIRPKHLNQSYYIRIDTYEKLPMKYFCSMLYPIRYTFLPVHRLSLHVDVPLQEFLIIPTSCPLKCLHGQCRRFSNTDRYFCHCNNGYSGRLCTVKNSCNCSSDSICIAVVNHRSICVCPLEKFGPRCYLKRTACMSNPCYADGQCIATYESVSQMGYFCICHPGSMGSRCQDRQSRIEFTFAETILIPQSILIHFVYIPSTNKPTTTPILQDPIQTTLISKVKFHDKFTFIYYGSEFHLIFVKFDQKYYLALLEPTFLPRKNLTTTIIPEHRCVSMKDLLDNHIQVLSRWHRAKFYHIPCQKNPNLVCFYDNDFFMCLCNNDRHANCFKFNYGHVYNCFGYHHCENDGQCYQDNNTCPTSSTCFCKECYFGSRCQFSSRGFGLSLDDILGYSIQSNVPFSRQPIVVKISTAFTLVMFIIAIINGVISTITFKTKRSLEIGSGFYLLALSITSCLTMAVYILKFLFLLLSQMSIINRYSFLLSNCIIMDILLKSFLTIGDWLTACVSIERAVTVKLELKFKKTKSTRAAKRVIFGIYLLTFASFMHDPIHRHLLNDTEEQRTWCVVHYTASVQRYASFISIFQFVIPLSISFIAFLYMIALIARHKSKPCLRQTNPQQSYRQHLWKQILEHQHQLIGSFILVIIAMPRLIIALVSPCMKSARNPWLYLAGYWVSFAPASSIYIVFVLPSRFYRKELREATARIKKSVRRRFRSA